MALSPSRTSPERGRPPRLAGRIRAATNAHSASVRSLGERNPRRSAATRCSGFPIRHLAPTQVPHTEPQPVPETQLLPGWALTEGAGPDGLFGLYRLRLCCLGPSRGSGALRQPPTVQKHLSLAGSLFLSGGREKVGEDASQARLLATAPLGVMGRSSRRNIGPSEELWVSVPRQIDPVEGRGRNQHGSDKSAEHTIRLAERQLGSRLSDRVIRTSIPRRVSLVGRSRRERSPGRNEEAAVRENLERTGRLVRLISTVNGRA
jgi:hypothetical protein